MKALSERADVRRIEALERPAVAVGSVHDPVERDADRLAERALAISNDYTDAASAVASDGAVRRADRPVRRTEGPDAAHVDGLAVDPGALGSARSGGRALDPDVRARLEHGFGSDLGAVRIHTNPEAAGIARQIQARAFTHGTDVFFGEGEYRPGTADGDHVLAHEVAHTVQNQSGDVHRFPATWSTSPVPWQPMTDSVFRPGEGASGGVYILTSKEGNGPVKKAVAKPVFGENGLGMRESGQQLQFSDAALGKLLGLSAPTSKVVMAGGTEFAHLVALCQPKQPAPAKGEKVVPLSKAESFVVMSEVPNATSLGSLADKAPNDKKASADLFRAVFDPILLTELGKLCIGDLMLGNPDRMVLGGMNLGNVMLSMQNGRAQLAAIDTTAYLPKAIPPNEWVNRGGSAGGGFANMKTAMTRGPGFHLDGFFEVLVDRLKQGTPANAGENPTWEVIETTYKANRDRYLSSFEFGWNDAMITALALSEDDQKLDAVTKGYDDPDVTGSTLKANLAYIGERAQGKSHEDSIGRPMAIAASGWVASVDRARLAPTTTDALAPSSRPAPAGKAITAEVATMPALPTAGNVRSVQSEYGNPLKEREYKSLAKFPKLINDAHTEVDNAVSSTKSRRKGVLGAKEDVPRNRSVVSHYVVHATAMGAGGGRAADAATFAASIVADAQPLFSADFRGSEAAGLKSLLREVGVALPALESTVNSYQRQVNAAAPLIAQTRHGEAGDLSAALAAANTYLDEAKKKIATAKKLDPQRAAANIVSKPG